LTAGALSQIILHMESAQIISTSEKTGFGQAVHIAPAGPDPSVIVVCEHASNHIPKSLDDLGLGPDARVSHAAWDPGAFDVARVLAQKVDAILVSGAISRLVYDCNRPPDAASAVPERVEIYDIPGNAALSPQARAERIAGVYQPFSDGLSRQLEDHADSLELLVTIHSFTPVFLGQRRQVELGLLHGRDSFFCEAMMAHRPAERVYDTRINEPYSAADGVAHTLDLHGCDNGLWNVMIEIRNDLIQTAEQQARMAAYLAEWITATRHALSTTGSTS
jgi:predicted N-formylglutamate amidohydrolase